MVHWALVHNPNGISISSAVFALLMTVTDRQTDRPHYSVSNNRPQLRTQYGDAAQKWSTEWLCHMCYSYRVVQKTAPLATVSHLRVPQGSVAMQHV